MKAARGSKFAVVPVVVEGWASPADEPEILFHVNRTPITAEINMTRRMKEKNLYGIFGCGLSSEAGTRLVLLKSDGTGSIRSQ